MGANNIKCCTDPNFAQGPDQDDYSREYGGQSINSTSLVINEFELCKKGDIHQEKIEIQMRIQSIIPDDEIMDDCISLTYNVEVGELHERDKYSWIEVLGSTVNINKYRPVDDEMDEIVFKKMKTLDFEFKMNHIK